MYGVARTYALLLVAQRERHRCARAKQNPVQSEGLFFHGPCLAFFLFQRALERSRTNRVHRLEYRYQLKTTALSCWRRSPFCFCRPSARGENETLPSRSFIRTLGTQRRAADSRRRLPFRRDLTNGSRFFLHARGASVLRWDFEDVESGKLGMEALDTRR